MSAFQLQNNELSATITQRLIYVSLTLRWSSACRCSLSSSLNVSGQTLHLNTGRAWISMCLTRLSFRVNFFWHCSHSIT